jgi:hypothetical protein
LNPARRAFLVAAALAGFAWRGVGETTQPTQRTQRTWVIDNELPQGGMLLRRAPFRHAQVAVLEGDAGWLWFGRLASLDRIAGVTRAADAFVLTQLGASAGMRATQRRLDGHAMLWTLER